MNKQEKQIGFALRLIKTEQFAILSENYILKESTNVDVELEFKIDEANEYVGVFTGFEFVQSGKTFIKLLISCHFAIQDESWKILKQADNKIIFPKNFVIHLATLSVGVARGVLAVKAELTEFSSFMIPLLDITEIITADAVFDLGSI